MLKKRLCKITGPLAEISPFSSFAKSDLYYCWKYKTSKYAFSHWEFFDILLSNNVKALGECMVFVGAIVLFFFNFHHYSPIDISTLCSPVFQKLNIFIHNKPFRQGTQSCWKISPSSLSVRRFDHHSKLI